MKKFEDYENEIYTCSRCGLCQSVCPVFELTKKETMVSRGFFSTLFGVLRGDLKFNKKLRKNIDKCLTCNKCREFCPSGIDAEEIMISAKIATFRFAPFWKKLAIKVFYSDAFLRFLSLAKLYKVFPVVDFTPLGKILHGFLRTEVTYKKQTCDAQKDLKVAIFPGCINNYFNNSPLSALRMLLEKNGVEYVIPEFSCCSMPGYNVGDVENFQKFAVKNLALVPDDVDFLLFDCATCKKAFRLYVEVLDGADKEKAQQVFAKCRHVNEFFAEQDFDLPQITEKLDYHKPCHIDCHEKTLELVQKKCDDFAQLPDRCCGSAGLFFVENMGLSNKLAKKRADDFSQDAEYVITDCPLCRLGLLKGAVLAHKKIKVCNFAELFAKKL